MVFQDNVIKQYLKNVFFVTGTPCGGKTSVSRKLGERYGIPVYSADSMFPVHLGRSDAVSQPNMNETFSGADEFFGRTAEEYEKWLTGNIREQLDFLLLDLIKLSQYGKIICDCHLTLEQAEKLTDPSRTVFLIKDPSGIAVEYAERPDHEDFRRFAESASDPDKAKALYGETLYRMNKGLYDAIRKSSWFFIDRAEGLSVESAADKAAEHFGLGSKKQTEIEKIEKDSPRRAELIDFIENWSWEETKEHTAAAMRKWDFAGNEAVFAAVSDGMIVGMATLMNTDYYPLPEIYPWVSCIFVSESHRGNRISEKLINAANMYAKSLGYKKTYIPSPYLGLYERFGYRYLKEIVNYGGGTDHLFAKEL